MFTSFENGKLSKNIQGEQFTFASIMHTGNTVDVKVGAFIRQWVMAYKHTDTIKLEKTMNLWAIIKQHLETMPNDGSELDDRSEYISIELLDTTNHDYYNHPSGKKVYMNTLYRCYIAPAGQAAIQRYLENQFRAHFRVYMTAHFSDGKKNGIRHAIGSFLTDYNLPIDDTVMGRLSKDWYRFRQKHGDNYPITIFF